MTKTSYITVILATLYFPFANAYTDKLDALLLEHIKPHKEKGIQYHAVDYNAWRDDKRHVQVRDEIINIKLSELKTRNEQLAYWINAYNVLTIDLIMREGEQESIKNLGGFFSSPWKKFTWMIDGKDYSLDNIEHDIIRQLGEPHIHFAINCAAKSCPDLRKEAYRADKLEQQLEDQARLTLANQTKGYKQINDKQIRITKVMDWFKKDFNDGDLHSWLQGYFPGTVNDQTKIHFFDYDWSLNKQ